MKNMFESAEVFEHYAKIDCCYYMLQEVSKEFRKPRSSIEIMIDRASGYEQQKMKELREASIELLEQIIESKKAIEADYTDDEFAMNQLIKLRDETTTTLQPPIPNNP